VRDGKCSITFACSANTSKWHSLSSWQCDKAVHMLQANPMLAAKSFGFSASKRGRRNPLLRQRYFVCKVDAKGVTMSYWKSEEDALEDNWTKRRGLINVTHVYLLDSRRKQTHRWTPRQAGCSSESDSTSGSDDESATICSVAIVDRWGRVFTLKGVNTQDWTRMNQMFMQSLATAPTVAEPEPEPESASADRLSWTWDETSHLTSRYHIFALSGLGNCIATKIDNDQDSQNCLVISPPIRIENTLRCSSRECSRSSTAFECDNMHQRSSSNAWDAALHKDKHTISVCMTNSEEPGKQFIAFCGVVKDGVACGQRHLDESCADGWFMSNYKGGLCGNGKHDSDMAGQIKDGQVLTMQVDVSAGSLKFWVDGKPHGPGFACGVQEAPLRWAATVYHTGITIEIVPTPELQ